MASKSNLSDNAYRTTGTLFGVASFTAAPFLIFMWVGSQASALILVPLAMLICFKMGHEFYNLASESKSSYIETLQSLFVGIVTIVILAGVGFEAYDFFTK